MARDRMPLTIGLRLDVLDNEGIWNTGRIADVARDEDKDDELVEIKYDGWGDEYNEWVAVSEQRLAPLHMFTIVKKCWAKLNKWPWWPAFVVLRAPTKRGAVEALEAETKVYVEFFDAFEEDKRSRCWMQRKSVVSFDDNFEERAAKNVGKNFHQFVERTQRALASSSPLLFAGAGTLPIEYSSKSPLSLVAHKQKLGDAEWFAAFQAFSDRYTALYGFGAAEASRAPPRTAKKARAAIDVDVDVAGDNGDESEEGEEEEEEEEEEASAGEEEEEEESTESARGRRSARGAPQKRKLPARANTRRNAQKRVKAIEQLLQYAPAAKRSEELERRTARARRKEEDPPHQTSEATYKSETSIVLTLEDANSVAATPAPSASAIAVESSETKPAIPAFVASAVVTNLSEPKLEASAATDWTLPLGSQIYLIPEAVLTTEPRNLSPASPSTATRVNGTPIRKLYGATSPSTPLHRRKTPRVISPNLDLADTISVRDEHQHQPAINQESGSTEGDARDDNNARFWTGGSRYEIDNEPWKIQSWFIRGLKQKLLQQQQQRQ